MKKKKEEFAYESVDFRINGSGMFHFNSSLSQAEKLEILDWLDSLSPRQREFVKILRNEASNEAEFFADCD